MSRNLHSLRDEVRHRLVSSGWFRRQSTICLTLAERCVVARFVGYADRCYVEPKMAAASNLGTDVWNAGINAGQPVIELFLRAPDARQELADFLGLCAAQSIARSFGHLTLKMILPRSVRDEVDNDSALELVAWCMRCLQEHPDHARLRQHGALPHDLVHTPDESWSVTAH